MKLESENVLEIELELTGYCNLKCPLCANQYSFTDHIKGKNIRKIDDWIRQLDKFKNLKSVYLAGILSEPTLYPYLFGLIDYLHSRCITIELYSNGNTHNQKWWNDLNKHVNEEDKVFFTICGSTQDIHSRYRVNSNLQQIIDNVMAFKQDNKNKNDWIQHIKFDYNIEDFNKNMKQIISMFSNSFLINSLPYNERFNVCDSFFMPHGLSKKYKVLMNEAMKQKKEKTEFKICCKSLEQNFLAIDQFGNEFPCFLYRFYSKDRFDHRDYSKILNYEYDFCFECERHSKKILEMLGIERMC